MSALRELVEEVGNIGRISARAFINELKDIDEKEHYLLLAMCEEEVCDRDTKLVEASLEMSHLEERAKKVLAVIESAAVVAVTEYVNDKWADFSDEDDAMLEDFECSRDTLPKRMLK